MHVPTSLFVLAQRAPWAEHLLPPLGQELSVFAAIFVPMHGNPSPPQGELAPLSHPGPGQSLLRDFGPSVYA